MISKTKASRVPGISIALFLSAGFASGGIFSRTKPTKLAVRTTAYTHSESDHLEYGRKNAAGGTLKYGRRYSSAAADWSKFPLGTKFKIDGMDTTFVVDDYGSALVGTETIDIYKPSKSAMNRWGVKHVDIKILEYGDYDKSREILEERTKYAHVRKMLAGIKRNPGPKPQRSSAPTPEQRPLFAGSRKATKSSPGRITSNSSPSRSQVNPSPASPARKSPPSSPHPVPPAPPIPEATTQVAAVRQTAPARRAAPSPTHRLREVRPLQLATARDTDTKTSPPPPSEPVAAEPPAQARESDPAPPRSLRLRVFRPLIASANG